MNEELPSSPPSQEATIPFPTSRRVTFAPISDGSTKPLSRSTYNFSRNPTLHRSLLSSAFKKPSWQQCSPAERAALRFNPDYRSQLSLNIAASRAAGGARQLVVAENPELSHPEHLAQFISRSLPKPNSVPASQTFTITERILPVPSSDQQVRLPSAPSAAVSQSTLASQRVPAPAAPRKPAAPVSSVSSAASLPVPATAVRSLSVPSVTPEPVQSSSPSPHLSQPRGIPSQHVSQAQQHSILPQTPHPAAPSVIEAPSVASPSEPLLLQDLTTGHYLNFFQDGGSSWTIITLSEAKRIGATVIPWSATVDPGIPNKLPVASNDGSALEVLGITQLKLQVALSKAISVNAAVCPDLFCSCLLGRNVIEVMEDIHHLSGPVTLESGATTHPSSIPGLDQQDGFKAYLVSDIRTPSTRATISRLDQRVMLEIRIPEQELMLHGRRVIELTGQLLPHSDGASYVHTANALATASVDWSPSGCVPGKPGLRRARFLTNVTTAVACGSARRLLSAGAVLGRFIISTPTCAAVVPPSSDPLLSEVLDRTFKHSPFLKTQADRDSATRALGGFCFTEELTVPSHMVAPPLVIQLEPGAKPYARRNYRVSADEEIFAEETIRKWLRQGVVRPSESSPWSSPIIISYHARTGKPRLCIDYRALNAATVTDEYLLPLVSDITRAIRGKVVFSKVDLSQGFNQFEVSEESRHLTSFAGPRGQKYEFVGSPFGLKNVPAAFQRVMDRVLGTMLWERASVYVDDIIIFSASVQAHHADLTELASRLRKANIFVRASKCTFYVSEVEYLGYIVSGSSVRVMPEKVEGILNVQIPVDRKELRRFLGLTGQFRHLIFHYADIARPLEQIKHKESVRPFDLSVGSPGERAFQALKQALLNMPSLSIPDMNKPFFAYVDASHWAMSMVLCQEQNNVKVPIGFYSKTFNEAELTWSIPVKEATALHYFAMGPAWPYLASRGPHTIFVDSLSSNALAKATLQNHKLVRHAIDLCSLNLVIRQVPGSRNIADAPTRPPFVKADPKLQEALSNPLRMHPGWAEVVEAVDKAAAPTTATGAVVAYLAPFSPSADHFAQEQAKDPHLVQLRDFIRVGRPPALPMPRQRNEWPTFNSRGQHARLSSKRTAFLSTFDLCAARPRH